MKTLLILSTLIFSVMFSSTSFAEWKNVSENVMGTFYLDFERIRKHGGYVYYWVLIDYLKPNSFGDFSSKSYNQGDCKLIRLKYLSDSYYKEQMGRGTLSFSSNTPDKEWRYPPPNSVDENFLKSVCSR